MKHFFAKCGGEMNATPFNSAVDPMIFMSLVDQPISDFPDGLYL